MAEIRIEPFDKAKHQRKGFQCGKPALDEFLRVLVTQYEKRGLGKTFVAVAEADATRVIGFYTLAASTVTSNQLPGELAKKLPKHPIPVVLLGRLAVDQGTQGQGVGKALLIDALHRCLEISESLGLFAVEVVAIDEEAAKFYAKFGFTALLDDAQHMYLPISTIRQATAEPASRRKPSA